MAEATKRYLYLMEIVDEDRAIIIIICEMPLWELIPITDEAFNELLTNYPGYAIYELDEIFLRERADRQSYLNPN
jgi:hypothetical protein